MARQDPAQHTFVQHTRDILFRGLKRKRASPATILHFLEPIASPFPAVKAKGKKCFNVTQKC
jgi:hypothetical protein